MTQENLAEQLNVSPEYCSKIECGKAKVNLERLAELSAILNTDICYLISGTVFQSSSYLNQEIADMLQSCSKEKIDTIVKIIDIISKM